MRLSVDGYTIVLEMDVPAGAYVTRIYPTLASGSE
jgi:hypothetical protein